MSRIQLPTKVATFAQRWLDDYELEATSLGIDAPVEYGSDAWLTAQANAHLGFDVAGYVLQAEADSSDLTATEQELDDRRKSLGLPEINATVSRGRIIVTVPSGTRAIQDGTPGKIGAIRFRVNGNHTVTDKSTVAVVSVDTGTRCNFAAGETFTFDTAPVGVSKTATVSASSPIKGATDAETDEQKRARILLRRQNPPGGGNAGHAIEIANEANRNLAGVFVYPALGGPASAKVAVAKPFDLELHDYSRELDSDSLAEVRSAIQALYPIGNEIVVSTVADDINDIALHLTIPDSALAGGDGKGWTDETPWPPHTTGVSGTGYDYTVVNLVSSNRQIRVDSQDTTGPTAGLTNIAWWSSGDMRFYVRLVVTVSGGAGLWVLTLDQPLVDSQNNPVAAGDFICPAATYIQDYGKTLIELMGKLGPGENTTNTYRVPRAARIPEVADGWPSQIDTRFALDFAAKHPEISGIDYGYRTYASPAIVPASVNTAPNIWVPRHFGIYPA